MASNVTSQGKVNTESNTAGFGRFKLDLADNLTQRIVTELATLFEYPPASLDELWNTKEGVGQLMVTKMEERGEISATDISPLMEKLRIRKYDGAAQTIQHSFDEHVSKSTKFTGRTGYFVDNLKKGYKKMLDSVRPVPFQQLRRPVESIFVESNLEKMEEKKSDSEPERWKKMESADDLTADPRNRILLEGEPGFGKSTLMLHLVYKWCASLMCLVDVLILLRFREVGNLPFFKAIERSILPNECSLYEKEIKEILTSEKCRIRNMLIILDGYDEFIDSDSTCDVINIINSSMFPMVKVIITTRPGCLPREMIGSSFSRMRLGGFDEAMQMQYIKKAITENKNAIVTLMNIFKNNALLSDICQTPLFFALFAHLLDEDPKLQNVQSVTSYIRYLVKCFFSHEAGKSQIGSSITQKEHERLSLQIALLAFEGLKTSNKVLEWNVDDLNEIVDDHGFKLFAKVGVLIEEKHFQLTSLEEDDFGYWKTPLTRKIKFFHKTIQEYYSALHLKQYIVNKDQREIYKTLGEFSLEEINFMFLFACGLNFELANHILHYFQENRKNSNNSLELCVLETKISHGLIPSVIDAVSLLCQSNIWIDRSDSKLLQRAKVNLLQIAANKEIWSWYSNYGVTKKEIDHGLVDARLRMIVNCRDLRRVQFFSADHSLPVATLRMHFRYPEKAASGKVMLDVCQLKDPKMAQEYVAGLEGSLGEPGMNRNPERIWSD